MRLTLLLAADNPKGKFFTVRLGNRNKFPQPDRMGLKVKQRLIILVALRIGKNPVAVLMDDIAFLVALVRPIAPHGRQLRTGFESSRVNHARSIKGKPQQIGAPDRSFREFRGSRKLKADYGPNHAAIMFDG